MRVGDVRRAQSRLMVPVSRKTASEQLRDRSSFGPGLIDVETSKPQPDQSACAVLILTEHVQISDEVVQVSAVTIAVFSRAGAIESEKQTAVSRARFCEQ